MINIFFLHLNRTFPPFCRTGYFGEVPSLFNMCTHILQEHVDDIEECGGLPYSVLEPILSRATPPTLMKIEEHNPYLMEDTGPLWERFIKKKFPKAKREEFEAYREMYERCMREQEDKLAMLKMKVKDSYNREVSSHKKAKLAYVGGVAKAPRNIRAAQAKNGTALPINEGYKSKITGNPLRPVPMPSSSSGAGSSGRGGINQIKPRVAPMMAKTLKMVRGMKSGFRR